MKPIPKSTYRYKYDPIYRTKCLEASLARDKKNKQYQVYCRLRKVRTTISNWQSSIKYHKAKVDFFKKRIYKKTKLKEELELEWGALRAKIEKEKKEKNMEVIK